MSSTGDFSEQSKLACPNCGKHALRRDHRIGLMERIVFPWFHLYPWECANCRVRKLLKSRGTRKRTKPS